MFYGVLLSISAAISWGLVYVLEQKVLTEFSVAKFLIFESIFMFLVALPIALYSENPDSRFSRLDYQVVLTVPFILLMLATFLGNFFILSSVQQIGATVASMIEITFPLFVVIFAFYILRQPIHYLTVIGGILIMLGSALVIYVNRL
ncbi:MAG: transport protein [Parcubacteria group bacterium GW2011_GWC2_52_8c]|nr:MAG: transport protein [Parcubacteria group bacterium GW2011_GWA1_51_12]KKW30434.1 MAG: transport protein [Parcubacteria group bacterium GW2011_GWC2_52_8c]